MGWLYKTSLDGHASPRAYLDAQCTYERNDRRAKVLRSALIRMRTYYAASGSTSPPASTAICSISSP